MLAVGFSLLLASTTWGQQEGQADLNEAIEQRVAAKSIGDLEKVASLLKSAIAKGVNSEDQTRAKEMLASVQFERGQRIIEQLQRQGGNPAGMRRLVSEALSSMEAAVELDPTLGEAHLIIAQIIARTDGSDKDAILESLNKAIDNLTEDDQKLAQAYAFRSTMREEEADQLADITKAVELQPESVEYLARRAGLYQTTDRIADSIVDLLKIIELDPANGPALEMAVDSLSKEDRLNEARTLVDGALERSPDQVTLIILSGNLFVKQKEKDKARAAFDRAVELEPENAQALMARADAVMEDDPAQAREDLDRAFKINPENVGILIFRAQASALQGKYGEAIDDLQMLHSAIDNNHPLRSQIGLQMAMYCISDKRPRKAIEMSTTVIEQDPDNWRAYRTRGDARLSVSQHKEAVTDYEQSLEKFTVFRTAVDTKAKDASEGIRKEATSELDEDESGILNNLAWVLATSAQDDVRNGTRALELAKRASALTGDKSPTVLSTLAAAYAETGAFADAIKWSQEAVKIGESEAEPQIEQLRQELESYRQSKPFREEQKTEENEAPILAPSELIDT
jgi:tetratricopeptide (TPR) repeat protein